MLDTTRARLRCQLFGGEKCGCVINTRVLLRLRPAVIHGSVEGHISLPFPLSTFCKRSISKLTNLREAKFRSPACPPTFPIPTRSLSRLPDLVDHLPAIALFDRVGRLSSFDVPSLGILASTHPIRYGGFSSNADVLCTVEFCVKA